MRRSISAISLSGSSSVRFHVPEIRFDFAVEFNGERIAVTIDGLTDRDTDPAFTHAILIDIFALLAVEADTDVALQQVLVVVGTARVGGEAVGEGVGHGVTHSK